MASFHGLFIRLLEDRWEVGASHVRAQSLVALLFSVILLASLKSEFYFGFYIIVYRSIAFINKIFPRDSPLGNPPAVIEAYIGSAQLDLYEWPPSPTHFVRTYWYIESSFENRPNIALFRINGTITFNPNIHPIRLPFYRDFDYVDWSSTILGFFSPDGPLRPHLQSAAASILNRNLCDFGYSITTDNDLCALDGGEPADRPVVRYNGFTGNFFFEYFLRF